MIKNFKIVITKRERELIMKYGYPFEAIEKHLSEPYPAEKPLPADSFWWEQLAGNPAMSLNEYEIKNEIVSNETKELLLKIENHREGAVNGND